MASHQRKPHHQNVAQQDDCDALIYYNILACLESKGKQQRNLHLRGMEDFKYAIGKNCANKHYANTAE